MKDEFFNGISPTCSAVPRVRSLLIKGLKWAVYPILLSCPSSSSSSVFWSAEQDRYDPFSSTWDDPENGDVELKILCPCVTAISSAGSGSGEQNWTETPAIIFIRLKQVNIDNIGIQLLSSNEEKVTSLTQLEMFTHDKSSQKK